MAQVCDLSAVRTRRALARQVGAHWPSRLTMDAWHLVFRAQAAGVAYWVAMGRFHAQLWSGRGR